MPGYSGGKSKVTIASPDGLGAGWSDPVRVDGIGRSGELYELTVRGDVTDATAGTADVMLFAAADPTAGTQHSSSVQASVPVADLDPDAINDEYIFVEITGLTVAASATTKSDSVNFLDPAVNNGPALYAIPNNKGMAIWCAVKGVTGVVHVGLKARGD